MADKLIGKLTLDISDVQKKIEEVNKFLSSIGANINLEDKLSKQVSEALNKIVRQAREAGEAAAKAMQSTGTGGNGVASEIEKASSVVKTFIAGMDQAGNASMQLVQTVTSGFDNAGRKIKETADANNDIVRRTVEAGSSVNTLIGYYEKLYASMAKQRELEAKGNVNTSGYIRARAETEKWGEAIAQLRKQMNEAEIQSAKLSESFTRAKGTYDAIAKNSLAQATAKAQEAEEKRAAAVERENEKAAAAIQKQLDALSKEERAREEAALKAIAYNEKVLESYQKQQAAIEETAAKQQAKAQAQNEVDSIKNLTEQLDRTIELYKQYYEYMGQAYTASAAGNTPNANMYSGMAQAIQDEISAIQALNPWLTQTAQQTEEVVAAQAKWQATINSTDVKTSQQNVEAYANALVALYTEQAKLNNALASGKIKEGTQEYDAAAQKINHLEQAVATAGSKIDASGIRAAESMQKVVLAIDNLSQSEAKLNDSQSAGYLAQAENAYKNLTTAIKNYNIEKRAGNTARADIWKNEINASMEIIGNLEKELDKLRVNEDERRRILQIIEQSKTATGAMGSQTNEISTQVSGLITRYFSLMTVIRTISNLIKSTVEYISEYYDKMNEIRIITGKTETEAAALGNTYRELAREMSVSSLDMADAAIYFTRQGLGAAEVEKRLKYTTQYAKTANIEFERSAELITSVVNSMDLAMEEAEDGRNAAQRVADVFLAIGDNAATSGEEIGTAMQKAAAAAGSFNVEFEWLAAAIGAVSETTRQEASSIGTAFNTLIARLHSIRTTGFNSEDEMKINDIQKALANINVTLLDQDGQWRKMEDIFEEIAEQWDSLDGKTKSYIATTMAGVKQQNVFLALMEDMSQATEGTSRQQELYNIALDSAGTAQEKYAVYTDSVKAAQERLNVAQEQFYSLLNADFIKGWYDGLAQIVNTITNGTEKLGGLNIILPITIALFTALAGAIAHVTTKYATLGALFNAHPIMMIISAIGAAVTALTLLGDALSSSKKKFEEANKAIADIQEEISKVNNDKNAFAEMMEEVGDKTHLSEEELKKYNGLLERLSSISPTAKKAVEDLKNGFGDQQTIIQTLNEEMDKYLENAQNMAAIEMIQKYNNYQYSNPDREARDRWHEGWYEGLDGKAGFTKALQYAYNYTRDWDLSILGKSQGVMLTDDVYQDIRKWLDAGIDWDTISTHVWGKIFNGDSSYNAKTAVANEVSTMIDDAMSVVGQRMSEFDKAGARAQLTGMLFGQDGSLRVDDVNEAASIISHFISNAVDKSFDITQMVSPYERLFGFANSMIGDMTGDMYKEIFDLTQNNPDVINQIAASYEKLVKAGLSKADLQAIYSGMPVGEWADAYAGYIETRMGEVQRRIQASTEDWDFNIWDFFGEGLEDEIDAEVLNLLEALADTEIGIDKIKEATKDATSIDMFKTALRGLAEEAGINLPESGEEAEKTIADFIKEAQNGVKDIQAIEAAIKDVSDGKIESYSSLLGLAQSHPEIMAVINDTEKLAEVLKNIKKQAEETQRLNIRNAILGTEGTYNGQTGVLSEIRDNLETEEELAEFDKWLDEIVEDWVHINDNEKEAAQEAKNIAAAVKEAQQQFNNTVKEVETIDGVIQKLQTTRQVDFSDIINLSTAHPEIVAFADDADKLLEVLQKLKAEAKADVKENVKNIMLGSEEYFKNSEYYNPDYKNLNEYLNALEASGGDWQSIAASVDAAADNIVNAAERTEGAAESWLEAQAKIAEQEADVNWAKSNGFVEQLGLLETAMAEGGMEQAIAVFEAWDEKMRQAVGSEYPALIRAMGEAKVAIKAQGDATADLTKQTGDMNSALRSARNYTNTKYFTDSAKAIKQLTEGTISATEAYEVFNKEANKVSKAYEDILDVQQKQAYNANPKNAKNQQKIDAADVSNLATLLNMTTDEVLADFPGAVAMFDELTGAAGELGAVFDELNKQAFIRITGTSEADFSNLENGMFAVRSDAEDLIKLLEATGQWKVEEVPLEQISKVWDPDGKGGGVWRDARAVGSATVLKPTNNNPFSRQSTVARKKDTTSSGSRGGGGGGSDKNQNFRDTNINTEIERMLNMMSQVNSIQQSQQSWYQSQQKYYQQNGQLQGVIAYMAQEKDVLEAQNKTIEANIREIERYMSTKRAELAQLDTSDENYKEVADDLDKLQKAHQTYSKQLIDNKTNIDALNKSMDEQRKKIRQMEIDLRNTILEAIKDREKKRTDMLNAEIQMENTILELIKKRYERERDEIIETTNIKIDALRQERDLLDEQLRIRKEQAEAEDKAAKLRELEIKYQRILADPTRRKEANSIKTEIDALRKEMAWDLAENEVKAQQEAIDQQITSLEDYAEYVTNYYEDLFEHPQKLIEEMRNIMTLTQTEIIEWLKANDEEYKNSSENTQTMMVNRWEATYNEMKGILIDYWAEVEEIIAMGDEYIIEFLKNNSAKYAEAGKLQAEAYVDEWMEQLDNLHKAYQTVTADVASDYETIREYTGSASNKSSGGSGGRSGGSNTNNSGSNWFADIVNATMAAGGAIIGGATMVTGSIGTTAAKTAVQSQKEKQPTIKLSLDSKIKKYAAGGEADYSGLAILDGSKQLPERILSPYQTQLFDTMVEVLERMSRVAVSPSPNLGNIQTTRANPVSVGDIIVNVENLDTDDDYEELADKVSDVLMERIGRTAVVGGLRIRST